MEEDNSSQVGPLILNLERYVRLSADDRAALEQLKSVPLLEAKARGDLVREGQDPTVVRLVVSGWASRYKDLPDGRRQIVGFFIPGDLCDLSTPGLTDEDRRNMGALGMGALVSSAARRGHGNPEWAIVVVSTSARQWTPVKSP